MTVPPTGKSAQALRTIGEVVAQTGVAAHVLRYWERQVPALRPVRRAGDRRYYRAEDVALINAMARLINDAGYTLDGAARAAMAERRGGVVVQPAAVPGQPAAVDATVVVDAAVTDGDAPAVQGSLFSQRPGSGPAGGAISLARLRGLRDRLQNALDADDPASR